MGDKGHISEPEVADGELVARVVEETMKKN
jgi:hypothetical protein